MNLVSMKNKPKKTLRKANKAITAYGGPPDEPSYPWGLEVELNNDSIKKLKLDMENLSAGDEVYFLAKAKINRLSVNENINMGTGKTEDNSSVSMQITNMAWGKPGKDF